MVSLDEIFQTAEQNSATLRASEAAREEARRDIMSQTMRQALAVSMKEIYGWMLIGCLAFIVVIAVSYSPLRPKAIFPSWATIRRILRRSARVESCGN